jgi:16S rRNA processing protein RimM
MVFNLQNAISSKSLAFGFVVFSHFTSSLHIKIHCFQLIHNLRTPWNPIKSQHHRALDLYMSNGNSDQSVKPTGRRKKKNKYAQFSNVDKSNSNKNDRTTSKLENLDPFELLIAESQEKNNQLLKEKAINSNKKIDPDLLDDETIQQMQHEKRDRNKRIFPDNKSIDPYDPTTYGYVELGTILGPHGVHGLLKVAAVTDFPERLCKSGIRHLKAPNRRSPREIRIVEGRHRLGNEYLVKLEHVGDRNDALKLRGSVLYARQEERPEDMDDDEYLISELVDMEVRLVTGYGEDDEDQNECTDVNSISEIDEEPVTISNNDNYDSLGGKFVGIVGGVVLGEEMCGIPGLGQDLLEIILPRGDRGSPSWKDELVLIPFVPQLVPTVDLERKVLFINPPIGLLDLTYIKEEKIRIKGFLPEKSSWAGNR